MSSAHPKNNNPSDPKKKLKTATDTPAPPETHPQHATHSYFQSPYYPGIPPYAGMPFDQSLPATPPLFYPPAYNPMMTAPHMQYPFNPYASQFNMAAPPAPPHLPATSQNQNPGPDNKQHTTVTPAAGSADTPLDKPYMMPYPVGYPTNYGKYSAEAAAYAQYIYRMRMQMMHRVMQMGMRMQQAQYNQNNQNIPAQNGVAPPGVPPGQHIVPDAEASAKIKELTQQYLRWRSQFLVNPSIPPVFDYRLDGQKPPIQSPYHLQQQQQNDNKLNGTGEHEEQDEEASQSNKNIPEVPQQLHQEEEAAESPSAFKYACRNVEANAKSRNVISGSLAHSQNSDTAPDRSIFKRSTFHIAVAYHIFLKKEKSDKQVDPTYPAQLYIQKSGQSQPQSPKQKPHFPIVIIANTK